MSEPLTEKLIDAMRSLREQAAGGQNRILPEMVKYCWGLMDYILDLFNTEQQVPEEWRDALPIPLPKKGDLTHCDSWCGISLLDVVGKLFAKIIQRRLDSGKGCVDMVFCAR